MNKHLQIMLMSGFIFLIFSNSGCVSQYTDYNDLYEGPLTFVDGYMPTWISGEYNYVNLETFIKGGTYSYTCKLTSDSVLPQGLELQPDSCTISGTIILAPGSTKSISPPFTINVTDSSDPIQSVLLVRSITTLDKGPTINSNYDAVGNVDTDASDVLLATASGGTEPYTYYLGSMASATPPGTTVGIDGYLKGTPTKEGDYSVYICVKDAIGATACDYAYIIIYGEDEVPPEDNDNNGDLPDFESKYKLTVKIIGNGKMVSDDKEIDCGDKCVKEYLGLATINSITDADHFLASLEGCEIVSKIGESDEASCSVFNTGKPVTITATFLPEPSITETSHGCEFLQFRYEGTELVYSASMSGTAHADADGTCMSVIISRGSGDENALLDCGSWTKETTDYGSEYCVRKAGQPTDTSWTVKRNILWTDGFFGKGEYSIHESISRGECNKQPSWLYDNFNQFPIEYYCPQHP